MNQTISRTILFCLLSAGATSCRGSRNVADSGAGAPVEVAPTGGAYAIKVPTGPIPGWLQQPASPLHNPYASNVVALAEGRRLFNQYNCSGCHGGHGGGGMGPSLRDATWIYGNSDANVYETLEEGRSKGMPAWGTRIPQDQIWKLVAYVKSLGTPAEPEAPEQL